MPIPLLRPWITASVSSPHFVAAHLTQREGGMGRQETKAQRFFCGGETPVHKSRLRGPLRPCLKSCSVQGCSKFSPSSDPLSTKRYLQARSDQQRSITSLKTGDLSPPFPPRPPNKWATTNGRRRLAQSFSFPAKKNPDFFFFFLLLAC